MSDSIIEISESDVGDLRKDLFKAAMNRHWKKVVELYRDKRVQGEPITRANDTLLHIAVSGATDEIILDLLNIVHQNRGTITEPLKFQFDHFLENEKKYAREEPSDNREEQSDIQEDENKVLPPTYKVCIDLFSLMKNSISCIFSTVASNLKSTSNCKACCADEENQSAGARKEDDKPEDEYKPSKNQKQRIWFPPNYALIIFVFKLILSVIGIYIGQPWRGPTIAKLKQKHGNALQIMQELVDPSTLWEYEGASGGIYPGSHSLEPRTSPNLADETPSTANLKSPPSVEIDQSYYIPNLSKGMLIRKDKNFSIHVFENFVPYITVNKSESSLLMLASIYLKNI